MLLVQVSVCSCKIRLGNSSRLFLTSSVKGHLRKNADGRRALVLKPQLRQVHLSSLAAKAALSPTGGRY